MEIEKRGFTAAFVILLIASAALMAGILISLGIADHLDASNAVSEMEYLRIPVGSGEEAADPDAPLGVAERYGLTISDDVPDDAYLAFFTAHQSVRVYVDAQCVFSLEPSGSLSNVKTPGCNWIMIPITRGNGDREILVEILPVYSSVGGRVPEFLFGSERAIVMNQLRSDLPQLFISLLMVITGLVMLAIAGYSLVTKLWAKGLLSLGLYAVMLGLWRFFDMRLLAMFLPGHAVFLYYFSITMLMACPIPLTASLMEWYPEENRRVLEIYRMGVTVVFLAQMLLQLLGIADLRETLILTHIIFVIGIVILISISVVNRVRRPNRRWNASEMISWILVLGVLGDLLLYYWKRSSFGLLFTMLAFLCFVVSAGAALVLHAQEQERLLENKENQLRQSRITAMTGQIRSHFLFNILNAISGMCKYDPEKADETIICFARYLRANMDILQDDRPVTFHSALQHLEDYISLQQIRFGDRIRFVTDIGQEHFMLPPLILQPIVENAIKHGLTPKSAGGTITLRTWLDGDEIKLSIRDDGVGFDVDSVDESKSVGLQNVRFRLLHMMDGCLRIESTPGCGTTVTIVLPQYGQK